MVRLARNQGCADVARFQILLAGGVDSRDATGRQATATGSAYLLLVHDEHVHRLTVAIPPAGRPSQARSATLSLQDAKHCPIFPGRRLGFRRGDDRNIPGTFQYDGFHRIRTGMARRSDLCDDLILMHPLSEDVLGDKLSIGKQHARRARNDPGEAFVLGCQERNKPLQGNKSGQCSHAVDESDSRREDRGGNDWTHDDDAYEIERRDLAGCPHSTQADKQDCVAVQNAGFEQDRGEAFPAAEEVKVHERASSSSVFQGVLNGVRPISVHQTVHDHIVLAQCQRRIQA